MTTQAESGWSLPNRAVRAILSALEGLLGQNGLGAALKMARLADWVTNPPENNLEQGIHFEHLASLYRALEDLYGERSARGLVRQANHDAFNSTWTRFGLLAGLHDQDFQALPLMDRVKIGCKALSRSFAEISDLDLVLKEGGERSILELRHCPDCLSLVTPEPACSGMLGLLEGAMTLISPEAHIDVREVECQGSGHDHCRFQISLAQGDE